MKIKNIVISITPLLVLIACSSTNKNLLNDQSQIVSQIESSLYNQQSQNALNLSNELIAQDNSFAYGYILQAQAYQQLKDYQNSELSLRQAVQLDPKNSQYNIDYANGLCLNNKYVVAMNILQKYTKTSSNEIKNNTQASATNVLANCYRLQKNYDNAINTYEIVLQSKYPIPDSYLGITRSYLAQGNYPKASLYVSSYPNQNQNKEVLILKIKSLSGLLNGNYELSNSNKHLISERLAQLKQELKNLKQNSAPAQIIKSDLQQETKTATLIKESSVTITPPAKNTSPIDNNIKSLPDGRKYIVVEQGDTLFRISKNVNVSQSELIRINKLKNNNVPLGRKIFLN